MYSMAKMLLELSVYVKVVVDKVVYASWLLCVFSLSFIDCKRFHVITLMLLHSWWNMNGPKCPGEDR